jgi:hypothetical protein
MPNEEEEEEECSLPPVIRIAKTHYFRLQGNFRSEN